MEYRIADCEQSEFWLLTSGFCLLFLIPIVFDWPLARGAADFVEGAIRAPGFGIEPRRASNGQHVPVRTTFGLRFFGRSVPPARLELFDRGRCRRRVCRRGGRSRRNSRTGIVKHKKERLGEVKVG